ncbi:hypothetical protein [Paenibacillus donghaensis]|nr:hypothetical protein [Paenibacillus donghaensis]
MITVEKYKLFLDKLNQLSEETGVYIEVYDDCYYNPKLTIEPEIYQTDKKHPFAYMEYDLEKKVYIAKMDNPYDGEVI